MSERNFFSNVEDHLYIQFAQRTALLVFSAKFWPCRDALSVRPSTSLCFNKIPKAKFAFAGSEFTDLSTGVSMFAFIFVSNILLSHSV